MSRFLIEICLFGLLFLGISGLWLYSSNRFLAPKAYIKLRPEAKILIVGHSQPECAYNDSLIPNCQNIAQSGESYPYLAAKLELALAQNPQVETVWLEFSHNQIEPTMDSWIWGNMYVGKYFAGIAPLLPADLYQTIALRNPSAFIKACGESIKQNSKRIAKQQHDFSPQLGKYLRLERDKTDSLLRNPDALRSLHPADSRSQAHILALQKLVKMLKSKNKKLFFIQSPIHPQCPDWHNEQQFERIRADYFPEVELLDFQRWAASNQEFGDLSHLNWKGASRFSEWIAQLLQQGLLEQADKQAFINQHLQNPNQ